MKPPRPRHGDPVMGSLWRLVLGHVKGEVGRGVVGSGKVGRWRVLKGRA